MDWNLEIGAVIRRSYDLRAPAARRRQRDRAGGGGGAADCGRLLAARYARRDERHAGQRPDPAAVADRHQFGAGRRRAAAHQRVAALERPRRRGRHPLELRHRPGQLDRDPRRRLAQSQRDLRHARRRRPDLDPRAGGLLGRAERPVDRARALRPERPDGLDQR
nr:hypothetical protein [Catenulispora pinisilvae]